jgi:hypothetical protein
MVVEIVPFPAVRRMGLSRKMARLLATYNAEAAERTLHARLDATRDAMLRRSLAPEVVAREARSGSRSWMRPMSTCSSTNRR